MLKSKPFVIFLMGPTGSSKTNLAIKLSKYLPIDIISVDSVSVYREINVGTAKPSDYEQKEAPHRLINIRNISESYSVANFYFDAHKEIKKIIDNKRIPFLVGGTMFYFKSLLDGLHLLPSKSLTVQEKINQKLKMFGLEFLYKKLQDIDPISANIIHKNDKYRILRALEIFLSSGKTLTELKKLYRKKFQYCVYQFAISPSNKILLHNRIESRFHNILSSGLEDEVSRLLDKYGHSSKLNPLYCIGYKQMVQFLLKKVNYNYVIHNGIYETKQLAKRQMTWLRKWEKIYWLNSDKLDESIDKILKIIDF